MCKMVMATAIVLCLLAVQADGRIVGHDDDDNGLCLFNGKPVRTSNCTHGCCVDNKCGSERDCDTRHIVAIVVGVLAGVVCLVFVVLAVLWWQKTACFKNRDQPSDQAPTPGYPVDHEAPATGYPVDPQAQYPQAYANTPGMNIHGDPVPRKFDTHGNPPPAL
eukprot:TRINITY_DN31548_c0_g1_i1.p1 TRINITY_DN31548_c0_g1~~TRINITY_DN31548_c0_g1_i1.p1  ORF type:complete len:174 (+),score=47.23 TRINITY_DN31548_c0_g1_i1:35-523(+)